MFNKGHNAIRPLSQLQIINRHLKVKNTSARSSPTKEKPEAGIFWPFICLLEDRRPLLTTARRCMLWGNAGKWDGCGVVPWFIIVPKRNVTKRGR